MKRKEQRCQGNAFLPGFVISNTGITLNPLTAEAELQTGLPWVEAGFTKCVFASTETAEFDGRGCRRR